MHSNFYNAQAKFSMLRNHYFLIQLKILNFEICVGHALQKIIRFKPKNYIFTSQYVAKYYPKYKSKRFDLYRVFRLAVKLVVSKPCYWLK